jgi:type I restriction enzyme M protein
MRRTIVGAIAGDIIGSRFEFNNIKSKDFDLMSDYCFFTDDTVMTCAVAKAIMESYKPPNDSIEHTARRCMQEIGLAYPDCGYGRSFYLWLLGMRDDSYKSLGNGAAMRISPVGFTEFNLEGVKKTSAAITSVSHSHEEAIKGAEATAFCVWAAANEWKKDHIISYARENYYPCLDQFTLDGIRDTYRFYETCPNTVPEAIKAFEESTDYEDAIRNAISIGGDSDTLSAIAGGIAGAYYGVPDNIYLWAIDKLDDRLATIVKKFDSMIN